LGVKGEHLYNLFRPEFLEKYRIPLCSDAFSGFGKEGYAEHAMEIENACNFLWRDQIKLLLDTVIKK
jgi:hypothetical protein